MIRLFCKFGDIVVVLLYNGVLKKLLMKHWILPNVPLDTEKIVGIGKVCDVVWVLRQGVE